MKASVIAIASTYCLQVALKMILETFAATVVIAYYLKCYKGLCSCSYYKMTIASLVAIATPNYLQMALEMI